MDDKMQVLKKGRHCLDVFGAKHAKAITATNKVNSFIKSSIPIIFMKTMAADLVKSSKAVTDMMNPEFRVCRYLFFRFVKFRNIND